MSRAIDIANAWPEALPLPFVDYSGGADVATLFSAQDAAVIKRRSRQTQTFSTVGLLWKFNPIEWLQFLAFWGDDLGNGAASFSIELRYPQISALSTWIIKIIGELNVENTDNAIFEVQATAQLISLDAVANKATTVTTAEIFRLLDDTMFRRLLDDTIHKRRLR